MTVLGDRVFKDDFVKMGSLGSALIQSDGCTCKKRAFGHPKETPGIAHTGNVQTHEDTALRWPSASWGDLGLLGSKQ